MEEVGEEAMQETLGLEVCEVSMGNRTARGWGKHRGTVQDYSGMRAVERGLSKY